jgi:hypothetical protein
MLEQEKIISCNFFVCEAHEFVAYFPIYFNRLEWINYLHKLLLHDPTFAQINFALVSLLIGTSPLFCERATTGLQRNKNMQCAPASSKNNFPAKELSK